MKKLFGLLIMTMILTMSGYMAQAQDSKRSKNISSTGFWVIESNIDTPTSSTIYFYNNDQVMVYREKVEGKRINARRPKIQRRLKAVLEEAIVAWEKDHQPEYNRQRVMLALKH